MSSTQIETTPADQALALLELPSLDGLTEEQMRGFAAAGRGGLLPDRRVNQAAPLSFGRAGPLRRVRANLPAPASAPVWRRTVTPWQMTTSGAPSDACAGWPP